MKLWVKEGIELTVRIPSESAPVENKETESDYW